MQPARPPITKKRTPVSPVHLDLPSWEHETLGRILNVTLDVRHSFVKGDFLLTW